MRKPKRISVGKLKKMLSEFDDDQEIYLSADLHIEELRYTGGGRVYMKIAEPAARLSVRFKRAYPEVVAVFTWPTPKTLRENQTTDLVLF